MRTLRVRALLNIDQTDTSAVLARGQSMYNGMDADKTTYASPNPPLPIFLNLIQNLSVAQALVPNGPRGAAATRDIQRAHLITGMESERMYIQSLADAAPLSAIALIVNVGLVVASVPAHPKPVLTLRLGKQSGIITCEANVGLLVGASPKPNQRRFFNWQYTVDGGKTFISISPTPLGKTSISNLVPLTTVGVRVNLNNIDGPGEWSQVVTILVH